MMEVTPWPSTTRRTRGWSPTSPTTRVAPFGHRPGETRGEVVENNDRLAGVQQLQRHVAADISGSAGHKNAHRVKSFLAQVSQVWLPDARDVLYQQLPHSDVKWEVSPRQQQRGEQCPQQKKRIRKAVFPVAGLGTRFLPATKAVPKEMLTVVDRPVIQHVVDEAKAAGIEHFIFVTGRNKGAIEDHFDSQYELERTLAERGKTDELEQLMAELPRAGQTSFTRQQTPLGLGHAVWCAREIVGEEPFALLLPDMLHHAAKPCLADMIEAYERNGGNHIAVSPVPEDQTHLYGIVGVEDRNAKVSRITGMIEKPRRGTAPSNLHITGRYILQPEIFALLERGERGAGGEIQITDAMIKLAESQPFFAVRFDGTIYDCGGKIGFLTANIAYALARPDLAPRFGRNWPSCCKLEPCQPGPLLFRYARRCRSCGAPAAGMCALWSDTAQCARFKIGVMGSEAEELACLWANEQSDFRLAGALVETDGGTPTDKLALMERDVG